MPLDLFNPVTPTSSLFPLPFGHLYSGQNLSSVGHVLVIVVSFICLLWFLGRGCFLSECHNHRSHQPLDNIFNLLLYSNLYRLYGKRRVVGFLLGGSYLTTIVPFFTRFSNKTQWEQRIKDGIQKPCLFRFVLSTKFFSSSYRSTKFNWKENIKRYLFFLLLSILFFFFSWSIFCQFAIELFYLSILFPLNAMFFVKCL